MKKKLIISVLLLGSISGIVGQSVITKADVVPNNNGSVVVSSETSLNNEGLTEFLNSDIAKKFEAEVVQQVPRNTEVLNFNTWEEATEYLNNWDSELSKVFTDVNEKTSKAIPSDVDRYVVSPVSWGTKTKNVSWNVPGLSAQTVVSNHDFAYSGKTVTSSRGSYIKGVGVNTWKQYYSGGLNYSTTHDSIIKGYIGLFINVGGTQVGVKEKLGLVASVVR